jgi:hypothetical protein
MQQLYLKSNEQPAKLKCSPGGEILAIGECCSKNIHYSHIVYWLQQQKYRLSYKIFLKLQKYLCE